MKDVLSDILDTVELKGALYFGPTSRRHTRSACLLTVRPLDSILLCKGVAM